jgi:hypothetical protein
MPLAVAVAVAIRVIRVIRGKKPFAVSVAVTSFSPLPYPRSSVFIRGKKKRSPFP